MSFFSNRRQPEQDMPPRPLDKPIPALPPQQPPGFETVLGANSRMEGSLVSDANIRLDGNFTGTLQITGNVLVGESANISADINAKNISIAGTVRGNVSGNKVQLLRSGRVTGDIHAVALTMEEGAFLEGKISMKQAEPEAVVSEPAEPDFLNATVIEDEDDDTDQRTTPF